MIVGIDASNLRAGGGLTHLRGLLGAVRLPLAGIDRMVVWGGRNTLDGLAATPGVELRHAPAADGPLPTRIRWQRQGIAAAATRAGCNLLFIPGGAGTEAFSPRVVMCRNMLPFETREALRFGPSAILARLMVLRHAQARAFSTADGVIFLTDHARDTVTGLLSTPPRQSVIVPHGVEDRFRTTPRTQAQLSTFTARHPFRLLYVSTVSPYKHQDTVAVAVASLRHAGLPVAIDFVGSPETPAAGDRLSATLRRLDPAGSALRYLGPIPHSALVDCYRNANGFVFASSCENLPNTLLEAMAAGLPIASSNRGPMPEILGEGGVYFDPTNPYDLATALRRMLSDASLRSRVAGVAYDRARAYTWSRCAASTCDFLARVAAP